jgi:hypothetical protein
MSDSQVVDASLPEAPVLDDGLFGECSAAASAARAWSIGLSKRYSLQQPIRHYRLLGMGRLRASSGWFDSVPMYLNPNVAALKQADGLAVADPPKYQPPFDSG